MSAKEKATDLLLKYSILKDGHNHLVGECAIIAVDEIIEAFDNALSGNIQSTPTYWQAVRTELEKMK